jgi:hypothetical protein
MLKFRIEAGRHHVEIERMTVTVEAENAEAALALAKSMEDDIDIIWEEEDGYDDNYTWKVVPEE